MGDSLRILAIEPWLGGSHARFLEGWRRHSAHSIEVLGLPGRHWRWRLRDGARALAERASEREPPELLWASDYLDLPTFYGFLPGSWAGLGCVYTFHENQLTYPRSPRASAAPDQRDLHHGYTHVLSALRASRVVFNSEFHRSEFGAAASELLARLPRGAPRAAFADKLESSAVVHPGIDLDAIPLGPGPPPDRPLSVAFPHRLEHDKDPGAFLELMARLARGGLPFELHLFGERYAARPPGVDALLDELRPRIAHDGFLPSFDAYAQALGKTDVVVSIARHEFYGMGVLEAVAAGAWPLLPRRLSYPSILPGVEHWTDLPQLERALVGAAAQLRDLRTEGSRRAARAHALPHDGRRTAAQLDAICLDSSKPPAARPDLI